MSHTPSPSLRGSAPCGGGVYRVVAMADTERQEGELREGDKITRRKSGVIRNVDDVASKKLFANFSI